MRKLFATILLLNFCSTVFGQTDFTSRFNSGKSLFKDKKYNLAMETFKPLIAYDKNNPYSEYASFYYAASAYNQGYKAVAKDMFNQIKSLYPNWEKMNEVNFWIAKILLDERNYFQAIKVLSAINDKSYETDINAIKQDALSKITDTETLRMMHEEFPKDVVVAKALAQTLSKNLSSDEDRKQLEALIEDFNLNRKEFFPEAPKTVYKDKYAVALMMPFMVNQLEPTPGKKRTQSMIDFYEGAKQAIDTLAKQNINISLRVYDTERNLDRLKKYFETEELKNTDVIVGPLFPEENKVAQEFSAKYGVSIIHPISNLSETIGQNPIGYLFQPSAETIGRKSAEFLAAKLKPKKKDCMIFYGPGKKDSILAVNFQQRALEQGLKVLQIQKVQTTKANVITEILATPTEYDEFKYPSQFTLKKDSLHSIFVASEDPLIYTKVVGAVEMRNDSVIVVGSENWLDDNAIEFDRYQNLAIVLSSPNYYNTSSPQYKAFEKKYLRTHGRLATNMARMGYELTLFIGNQLKKNGVYFQDGLREAGVLPGYLGQGFDYRFSRDNQVLPFTAFKKGEYTLIDKR